MPINTEAMDTLKSGALFTAGAACFGAIIGAMQGAYAGAFTAICTDATFSQGIATGAKWAALAWAGTTIVVGSAMTLQSFREELHQNSRTR
ncbi:MAG: hypothetical protein EYC62_06870 [Alphaproteobacteria bacterium]|nr:MAG: hypothetical protein EYC62_06870 [Alphaproteobacteria bacterium]